MWVVPLCLFLASLNKTPSPPSVFDGIRAGMVVTDAKLASWQPDAAYTDAAKRTRLVKDAGDGAKYYVLVSGEVIARIGVEAPEKPLVPRLEKLWGKSASSTNLANESIASWSAAGWRAD